MDRGALAIGIKFTAQTVWISHLDSKFWKQLKISNSKLDRPRDQAISLRWRQSFGHMLHMCVVRVIECTRLALDFCLNLILASQMMGLCGSFALPSREKALALIEASLLIF